MPSQIFKNPVPNDLLKNLLDENAIKTETGYTINNCSYKKGIFNGTILKFLEECRPYYHISKRSYIDRKLTYKSFNTIIRQICNFNNITYTTQIKYDKSVYDIVYDIQFPYLDNDINNQS
jgi:hypothetical protein